MTLPKNQDHNVQDLGQDYHYSKMKSQTMLHKSSNNDYFQSNETNFYDNPSNNNFIATHNKNIDGNPPYANVIYNDIPNNSTNTLNFPNSYTTPNNAYVIPPSQSQNSTTTPNHDDQYYTSMTNPARQAYPNNYHDYRQYDIPSNSHSTSIVESDFKVEPLPNQFISTSTMNNIGSNPMFISHSMGSINNEMTHNNNNNSYSGSMMQQSSSVNCLMNSSKITNNTLHDSRHINSYFIKENQYIPNEIQNNSIPSNVETLENLNTINGNPNVPPYENSILYHDLLELSHISLNVDTLFHTVSINDIPREMIYKGYENLEKLNSLYKSWMSTLQIASGNNQQPFADNDNDRVNQLKRPFTNSKNVPNNMLMSKKVNTEDYHENRRPSTSNYKNHFNHSTSTINTFSSVSTSIPQTSSNDENGIPSFINKSVGYNMNDVYNVQMDNTVTSTNSVDMMTNNINSINFNTSQDYDRDHHHNNHSLINSEANNSFNSSNYIDDPSRLVHDDKLNPISENKELNLSKDYSKTNMTTTGKSKKGLVKMNVVEGTNFACMHCKSIGTPEWRRGPEGERTLCNACGLFYSKLVKKYGEESAKEVMKDRRESGKSHDRRVSLHN